MINDATDLELSIDINDINTNSRGTAEVRFMQTYRSEKYSDEGEKIIKLKVDDFGNLKIYKEEMLYSIKIE